MIKFLTLEHSNATARGRSRGDAAMRCPNTIIPKPRNHGAAGVRAFGREPLSRASLKASRIDASTVGPNLAFPPLDLVPELGRPLIILPPDRLPQLAT